MSHATSQGVRPDRSTVDYAQRVADEHGLVAGAKALGIGVSTLRVVLAGGRVRPGTIAQLAMLRHAGDVERRAEGEQ